MDNEENILNKHHTKQQIIIIILTKCILLVTYLYTGIITVFVYLSNLYI